MTRQRQFLLIDHHADARRRLAQELFRQFPGALIHEFRDAQQAVALAATAKLDAIIVHRSWDMDARSLIRILKAIDPRVPIIAMSGVDRAQEALAAGAARFLPSTDWAHLAIVIEEMLGGAGGAAAKDEAPPSPPLA